MNTLYCLKAKPNSVLFGLIFLSILTIWFQWGYLEKPSTARADLFMIWSGGCLVHEISGSDCPVLTQLPDKDAGANVLAMYPPWAVPVLYLVGSVPYETLSILWYHLSAIALALSAGLVTFFWHKSTDAFKHTITILALQTIAFLSFPPLKDNLVVGQFAIFQLLAFEISTLLLWKTTNPFFNIFGGVLLGLVAIKPQVISLIYFLIFLGAFDNRHLRLPFWSIIITLLCSSMLSFFIAPTALSFFLQRTPDQMFKFLQPNLGSFLWCKGNEIWLMFVPISVCIISITFRRKKILSGEMPFLWLAFFIPLGLFVGPYVNVYDFVFLLPGLICSYAVLSKRLRGMQLLVSVILALCLLILVTKIGRTSLYYNYGIFPLAILLLNILTFERTGKAISKLRKQP